MFSLNALKSQQETMLLEIALLKNEMRTKSNGLLSGFFTKQLLMRWLKENHVL